MNRTLPKPIRRPITRPITRPQTIARLRHVIRTLRAKNITLAEKLLIDLGLNLTA